MHLFLNTKSLIVGLVLVFTVLNTSAQNLSKEEVKKLASQAKSMGYSDQELAQYAKEQGVSIGELQQASLEEQRASMGGLSPGERVRIYEDSASVFPKAFFSRKAVNDIYFGYSFFSYSNFSGFESNIKLPTPQNYVLSAGDEIYIDIYGKSEVYYEAKIDADGFALLENIGPVKVSGLTIDKATNQIKSKLSKIYTGISGANPDTYLRVSLGSIRSITVQLAGELVAPGSYTMSSFSTMLNALHMAGGPTINGTLRKIQLFRNEKLISTFDLYRFLTEGTFSGNVVLQDNDVILVSQYQSRVALVGEFKRSGIYEISPGETLTDIMTYAGGFGDQAYKERVTLTRNLEKEKIVSDVNQDQFQVFTLKGGDQIEAGLVLNRFTNRVQIKGAIYRPGPYAFTDGLSLTKLIEKADGPKGDAYLDRVLITRMNKDLTTQTISANLRLIVEGSDSDVVLEKEDIVWVQSIFDLREEKYLKISGEITSPGTYAYSEGITLGDLIFKANGFTRAAGSGMLEISRRYEDQTLNHQTDIIKIPIPDAENLSKDLYSQSLKPFDHVMVRRNPNHFPEKTVKVAGEVQFPGTYSILRENERISDLIPRAGGLKNYAYAGGASLIRRTEFYSIEEENQNRKNDLFSLLNQIDTVNMTEADEQLRRSLIMEIQRIPTSNNQNISAQAKSERLNGIAARNALSGEIDIKTSELIPLDLEEILKKPGGDEDLVLEEGDIITIPQRQETIRLRGRVLYPTTVKYQENKGMGYFIDQAGGFDSRAIKRKTYALYANGEVARTKQFIFFRSYPPVLPGTEVIVPTKPIKPPVGVAGYAGIGTSLAALILAFSNLNILK